MVMVTYQNTLESYYTSPFEGQNKWRCHGCKQLVGWVVGRLRAHVLKVKGRDVSTCTSSEQEHKPMKPEQVRDWDRKPCTSSVHAWRMQRMRKRMGWGMVSSWVGRKRRWVESQGVRRGRRVVCKLDQCSTAQ